MSIQQQAPRRRTGSRRAVAPGEFTSATGAGLSVPLLSVAGLFLIVPIVLLVKVALAGPTKFGNFKVFFANNANLNVIITTFLYSAIAALVAVLIGSVLAWSLNTSASKLMRNLIWVSMLVPFLMGVVTQLYALTVILNTHGIVNSALTAAHTPGAPFPLLYNQYVVLAGLTYEMLPFAVLPLYASFSGIDVDLPRAAEGLGASRTRAILGTVLPLSLSSMLASWTIIFMICSGFFLTPVLLGGLSAPFISSLIQQDVYQFYDIPSAAVSALVLLVGSLVVVAVAWLVVGGRRLAKAVPF